jgi:hypothetical protein
LRHSDFVRWFGCLFSFFVMITLLTDHQRGPAALICLGLLWLA